MSPSTRSTMLSAIHNCSCITPVLLLANVLFAVLLALQAPNYLLAEEDKPRESIGQVLGKTVYRDAIRTGKGLDERTELVRLFIQPVLEKYRKEHKAEIEPTEAEIDAATAYIDKGHRERMKTDGPKLEQELKELKARQQSGGLSPDETKKLKSQIRAREAELKPPGRLFVEFMLDNWKLQQHLYEEFGGGRILWQQLGTEAFDATRKFLETTEREGEFRIDDPKMRATVYEYWTTQKHGSFLSSDPKEIESFLNPEWIPKK